MNAAIATGQRAVSRRPLGRAMVWLAGLAIFFYASYGFTNWLSGLRDNVPSIVFDWERHIPFIGWTIVPYWTTNLFYAASIFLCRSRDELDTQARRLLTAQIIAITCFILFPLKFSWPKPDVTGFAGFFYEALGAFDRPFNQAPSLHVALTVILAAFYFRLLPPAGRWIFAGWSALVVVSVLTTYQHHFIDIPAGFALGLACVWLWPFDAPRRALEWRPASDPRRVGLALKYTLAAALAAVVAAWIGGVALWLFWLALSLALVALAYIGPGAALFDKSGDGRMGWPARILLAPYLVGAWINSRAWTARDAASIEIADGVYVGRFPSRREASQFAAIIDLTAEFHRPAPEGRWASFPMLDLVAPEPATLRAAASAIEDARASGPVLVCCALGYGRSVASVATWLVRGGRAASVEEALTLLRAKRPRLVLKPDQIAAITEASREG